MKRERPTLMMAAAMLGACVAASLSTPADARAARCVIVTEGERYAGPCDFRAERGGSFSVERTDGGMLPGDAALLSLSIVSRGVGEVRALLDNGINARWGEAERSTTDPACWIGPDFSLCAY